MSDSNISRCAAPHCDHQWHKMGEGKLFLFHLRTLTACGENSRKAWLCEDCFENWEVTMGRKEKILLYPLARAAS